MDVQSSEKVILLHGDLDLKIIEAQNLPNMDLFTERLRRCFTVCDACVPHSSANAHPMHSHGGSDNRKIKHHRRIITSDPYVKVVALEATLARTRVITNTQNPEWNENFKIPMAHPVINLEFLVKDSDVFGAQLIGRVRIPASQIAAGEVISGWFQIRGPSSDAKLHLEMKFTPCDKNQLYHRGIADDPEHNGVRNTYFPLRKGGLVTLYRDAHVLDGMMPEIELDGGDKVFQHEKCWEDICYAILEAHHLIYLVGWSIYHKVRLTRETTRTLPGDRDWTLGELLKYKSEEGVRVLLLVWDDKTSHDKYLIKTEGVMQTHDEETRRFFKHSSVICVLSPRYASNKLSYIKQQVVGTFFTHHQKCVLVDTQAHGNYRKITAFLGGLDLCDGRYDTPEHRLFRDLNDVFKDDFHNPAFAAGIKAPRQPWHDLHCKIEGPAAYDVLINFEQRWRKATRWTEFGLGKRITHSHDDALLKIGRISWILSPAIDNKATVVPGEDPNLWVSNEENHETCHVQIFRSIDSGSAKDFPITVDAARAENLLCSKNVVMDKSIQIAYIQAIRSAQHFIYIENQYFIGSSYAWPSYKNAGADNLIPMELALKIASKIRANERFAVYIVIPMWPEGDPESAAVQEILLWQGQTMQMMYDIVARELESMHLIHSHPQDYLNFYCLGKREEIPGEMLSEENQTATSGVAANKVSDSFKFRRFMIYVHAKGMVVDDEYVIVGSANINERSLAGTRDTEIAMGAYQPHHCCAKEELPRGQVYGYRMSLWAEHLGMPDESFKRPDSIDCLRKVNEVAEDNWKRYAAEEFTLLQGHLIKYPLKVGKDGKVAPLPNHETFPDFRGKILGDKYPTLPDDLTT